ncbi:unnamed protein product, partial [Pylaiella littoralis]
IRPPGLVGGDSSALRGISGRLLYSRQVHVLTDNSRHKRRNPLLFACLEGWVWRELEMPKVLGQWGVKRDAKKVFNSCTTTRFCFEPLFRVSSQEAKLTFPLISRRKLMKFPTNWPKRDGSNVHREHPRSGVGECRA